MRKKYDYSILNENSKKSRKSNKMSHSGYGAESSEAKTNDKTNNKKNVSPLPRIPEEESSKDPRTGRLVNLF